MLFQAPITEEFIYRACMIPLLVPSFGLMGAIFICPLLFGVGKDVIFSIFTANDAVHFSQ